MTEKQIKLVVGSLLHDIGKVVYRSGDGRNHSRSGYDYLKNETKIEDPDILHCVLFHHSANLKNASLEKKDFSYIVYFADNVAASADRRDGLEQEEGFDRELPLASVFNILNGNREQKHYARQVLDTDSDINFPTDKPVAMDENFYKEIIHNITDNLWRISFSESYINSLLSVLEGNLSYIPSSTSKRELADISLYDHIKITAAVAQCIEQYLEQHQIEDYREMLYIRAKQSYAQKMFLLYSMDISGIQDFIYTTASKGALKNLRARSFYLEILMEHMVDELLSEFSLSRANLICQGGGHCYILLPNTESAKKIIDKHERRTNQWFLEEFGTALYVAGGYAECSANDLKNEPEGSYAKLYLTMSDIISKKKMHRYDAEEIRFLNERNHKGQRECIVCRKMGKVDSEGRCPVCAALHKMSDGILKQEFFTVLNCDAENALPLPGDMFLVADTKEQLIDRMESSSYVRAYAKNRIYTGKHIASKLWTGDYATGDTFEQFARCAEGIERLGVLRADVDNLGQAFVHGFRREDGEEKYVTLSRTATLSRQLSLFFKCYINQILEKGESCCLGRAGARKVAIVYSGGDDVFLVGAWDDIIESFVDIRQALSRFTQNTLTISGGIGIYSPGYPVNIMAGEVAALEELSKDVDGKNAVTLFDESGTYPWDIFCERVIGDKFHEIESFFAVTEGYGKVFLYHVLELLRNRQAERFNRARYVYFLSRMEPERDCPQAQKESYGRFSRKMYRWADDPQDCREVITAIYLYIYLNREKEEER